MDLATRLGRNLRDLRLERGFTQDELGFRTDLERSYISDMERGRRNPTVKVLERLAEALGVDASVLLRP